MGVDAHIHRLIAQVDELTEGQIRRNAEIARLRAALRHIADHYDAETSAHVPADPGRVGLPGPHEWVELSAYIERVLGSEE